MVTAKAMFLSRPYQDVTMEEIADAADLSKATLYKYFGNKLEIYSAIILSDARELADKIRAAFLPGVSVSVNLLAMAKEYEKFFAEHPEYFEKLSWFYLPGRDRRLSAAHLKAVNALIVSARAAIEDCLAHAMKTGELRRIDTKQAAMVIYAQWLGLSYLAVASGTARTKVLNGYGKLTRVACEMQLNGMVNSRARRGAAEAHALDARRSH